MQEANKATTVPTTSSTPSSPNQLSVIDGASLLAMDVDPPRFIVASLLPVGLHLLAGSPKIGKSWLALWLCNQISTGEKVWEFDTQKCGTLYISLEDTLDRLHLRLSRITEHAQRKHCLQPLLKTWQQG